MHIKGKVLGRGKWKSLAERFWDKVDRSAGPDACWPWLGSRAKEGHGHFHTIVNGHKQMRTTMSMALELRDGSRPEGAYALHKEICGNPSCCNPAHGYWGTHDENMHDKKVWGKPHRMPGEAHHQAKLTDEKVRELRRRYIPRHPVHGASAMARELGMSQGVVSSAIRGDNWSHLE